MKNDGLINCAGRADIDDLLVEELTSAGITVNKMPEIARNYGEMETIILGDLCGWSFRREWIYWVADGPGIALEPATKLHEAHGTEVRVNGHCGCPSPLEQFNGFAVGKYHVDTVEGLKALADTIRLVAKD